MGKSLDLLLVEPDSSLEAYQSLKSKYAAIEPPTWALLLAESCRSNGFSVGIMDCVAEGLTDNEGIERVLLLNPRLVVFTLYGQNPNSSTTSMVGATRLAAKLKEVSPSTAIAFVGNHVSALPREVLDKHPEVDIVFLNEGVYALRNLLTLNSFDINSLKKVRGIGFRDEGKALINPPEKIVPQERMDIDMPGYAWDLLPFKEKPLDLYRSHFWHADFDESKRTPFAAIYTSLGCKFKCDFCMINIVNRTDNSEEIVSSDSNVMRFWSTEWVLKELDKLAKFGVKTLRISDEMFYLNKKYYEPLLKAIIQRGYNFNMWTYSRVDSVNPIFLELFKAAGVNWLCLGIEAGNQEVRQIISKGKFQQINIRDVVRQVQASGIKILGNYIFGFYEETYEDLRATLDLALELNTEHANFYPCQALPGSPVYNQARMLNLDLPETYAGYAFLSYECKPLPTRYLSAAEVLKFRDDAWHEYFSSPSYLNLAEFVFGPNQRKNIEEMAKIRLRRKLLEIS